MWGWNCANALPRDDGFCCAAEYFTVNCQFMSPHFVCFHSLGDFYFITIISSSAPASEDPECNLSSSSDSHTPQRRPLLFWLNEPTAAVPSDAKRCTIFHSFSLPILLQLSVSSSEQACLPPAKAIIYIAALQQKHNHCFLWKTKRQCIIGAICFSSVSVQTMWVEWPQTDGVWGELVNETEWSDLMGEMTWQLLLTRLTPCFIPRIQICPEWSHHKWTAQMCQHVQDASKGQCVTI